MKKLIGIILISMFIFSTALADHPEREKSRGKPLHQIIASLEYLADILLIQNDIIENLSSTSTTESKTKKANVRMVIRDRFLAAADNAAANLIFLDIYCGKDLVKTIKHSVIGFDRLTKEPKIYTFEDRFLLTYKYANGTHHHPVFFCYDKEPPFTMRRFY
jgi:hypothetical protein